MSGITPLPEAPLVSDNTATFNAKAFALAAALEQLVAEINAEIPAIDLAYSAGLAAMGAANFKGEWSTLTGALAIPASVSYQGVMWVLKQNVSNVAAEVPGVSANWLDVIPQRGPAFSAYLTANQTVTASVWTKIPFETELFDTNSNFNASNGRFTPTVPGYYQFNAGALFTGVGINAFVAIYKNGAPTNYGSAPNASSTNPVLTGSALLYLNGTTDFVEVYGNTGDTAITGGGRTTFFQGHLARRA